MIDYHYGHNVNKIGRWQMAMNNEVFQITLAIGTIDNNNKKQQLKTSNFNKLVKLVNGRLIAMYKSISFEISS